MPRSTPDSALSANPSPTATGRWLLPVALLFPTALTLVYFVWMASAAGPIQRLVFAVAKLAQFLLPVLWWSWRRHASATRQRFDPSRSNLPGPGPQHNDLAPNDAAGNDAAGNALVGNAPGTSPPAPQSPGWPASWKGQRPGTGSGLCMGLGMGLAMAALMLVAAAGMEAAGVFAPALPIIRQKLAGVGVHTAGQFAALAVFYCLAHSLLEEYYFRWFLWRFCREVCPRVPAHLLAAVGFMSHHVVVLAFYFGWLNAMTWLGSLAVAVAGLAWSWLYELTDSLWPSWIAHILADAAIFGFGYHLLTFSITSP
ncbi:MAG: CPBP family intramembrane glutamic endopeptidase [Planctomycetaceae bacterium]